MPRTMKNNKTNCNVIFWHCRSTSVWPCHQINVCMSSPNLHVFLMLLLELNPSFSEHNMTWHFWTWRFEEWWAFKAFTHNFFIFSLHLLCVDWRHSLNCWTIHSIYKITTCVHLMGYCPFFVCTLGGLLFFFCVILKIIFTISLGLYKLKSSLRTLTFGILPLKTQVHNTQKEEKQRQCPIEPTSNDRPLTSFNTCNMNWWIFFATKRYIHLRINYLSMQKKGWFNGWWRGWKPMQIIGWSCIRARNDILKSRICD